MKDDFETSFFNAIKNTSGCTIFFVQKDSKVICASLAKKKLNDVNISFLVNLD